MACSSLGSESGPISGDEFTEELRIVLIGKTGNGKSASANTILNLNVFTALMSPNSVTSECDKARGTVCGSRVAVIDTPGIYDTKYKQDVVLRKLKECISLSAPGPHVFLIVIRLGKYTEEEQKTVELLQLVFGEKAADYTLVLFTHGEQLNGMTIEQFFCQSPSLKHLIQKCNGRYHVFSNTVPSNTQVPGLMKKIRCMVSYNGEKFYTNQMFQEAEKSIREQQIQILKVRAEEKQKEEQKLRALYQGTTLQEKLTNLDESYKKDSREKAEKKNKFIETGMILPTASTGLAIGTAATAFGGPLCMGVGAVVGGAVGAVVGALTPLAAKTLKNKCITQ